MCMFARLIDTTLPNTALLSFWAHTSIGWGALIHLVEDEQLLYRSDRPDDRYTLDICRSLA